MARVSVVNIPLIPKNWAYHPSDREDAQSSGSGNLRVHRMAGRADLADEGTRRGEDMEEDGHEDDVDPAVSELWMKLENMRSRGHDRRPNGWKPLRGGLKIGAGIVAITIAMGLAAAVVLFSHSFNYAAPSAKLTSSCSSVTATTSGSTIVFACSTNPALAVASAATGSVSYSSFNPTPPVNILDIYLIDTAVTLGPTCSTTSTTGNEPVALNAGGGSITISQTAGNLRPNHNYDYCMDFAALPPSFTTGVSWSQ